MVIGHQRRINEFNNLPPLKHNHNEIKRVKKVKSLGVIVDKGLKWKNQFNSLTGKLAKGLSSLKSLRTFLPNPNYAMFIVLYLRVTYATEMQYGEVYRQPNYKHCNACKIGLYQLSKVQDLSTRGLKSG